MVQHNRLTITDNTAEVNTAEVNDAFRLIYNALPVSRGKGICVRTDRVSIFKLQTYLLI